MKIAPALLCLAACSDSPSTPPDATLAPDAYDTARCLITGDYGDLGSLTGTAGTMGGITATITLEAGPPRDTFFLKMVSGKGVFTNGIAPGTYSIAGVDAQYNNCGLCVHIIADINPGSGPTKFYFASSGSVTLTSTTSPITGSAQDLQFVETDINSGQPVAGGCRGSIDAISFTAQ
jgi:hypothetical protein